MNYFLKHTKLKYDIDFIYHNYFSIRKILRKRKVKYNKFISHCGTEHRISLKHKNFYTNISFVSTPVPLIEVMKIQILFYNKILLYNELKSKLRKKTIGTLLCTLNPLKKRKKVFININNNNIIFNDISKLRILNSELRNKQISMIRVYK